MLISHEWVESIGGSENVFRELLTTFPVAEAACLWNNNPRIFDRPVRESWLATTKLRGKKAASLLFQPSAWRRVQLGDHDTVIASSHAFGHHLAGRAAREGRRAIAYVHTPARYIWAPEVEARGDRLPVRLASVPLKRIDRRATHPDVRYIANSRYIRDRIRRSWDVDATVVYPPVDVERIQSVEDWREKVEGPDRALLDDLPPVFVLGASRLVAYKRFDLVFEVGRALGLPVVIAGSGPDEPVIREQAKSANIPVTFAGRVSDELLYALYQRAALFVFMAVEDFGIMPVEAIAAGGRVLVNSAGGAVESVDMLRGGVAVDGAASTRELMGAADDALRLDVAGASARAEAFSRAAFRAQMSRWAAG